MKLAEIWRRIRWWFIYTGPQRYVTVDTFNGRLTFDSKQWLIGKYLYVKRNHEEYEIGHAIELLLQSGYLRRSMHSRLVLNAGANIGMTVIGLMKTGHLESAVAFEPAPANFRLLKKNVKQNGLADRVLLSAYALSSKSGQVVLELSNDNPGDHRIRAVHTPGFYREERRRTITVSATTLDDVLPTLLAFSATDVALIWVDIQGHEGHFLKGARRTINTNVPVVCEFWPYGIGRSGMSNEEFAELIEDLFEYFYEVGRPPFVRRDACEIKTLFGRYSGPRDFCTIVLIPRRRTEANDQAVLRT